MKEQSRLKMLREERNLSQTQLAEILGVIRQNISNWEFDFSSVRMDIAIRMADFFDVSLDYLAGRVYDKRKKELVDSIKTADLDKLAEYLLRNKIDKKEN